MSRNYAARTALSQARRSNYRQSDAARARDKHLAEQALVEMAECLPKPLTDADKSAIRQAAAEIHTKTGLPTSVLEQCVRELVLKALNPPKPVE